MKTIHKLFFVIFSFAVLNTGCSKDDDNETATLCDDLVSGGKSDWYLPSKDELNLMYVNLHVAGMGSFGAFRYWSSSEATATTAWRHDFADGAQFAANKGIGYKVRAIRSF